MRKLFLILSVLIPACCCAQSPVTNPIQASLSQALVSDWVGVLEYRDYSEPPTSAKRVQLPTWLHIAPKGGALEWHYIYDDGPTKTVEETDIVTFDPAASSYSEADNGKPPSIYTVTGYESLKDGRGVLVLSGKGTDNGKPSETRVTMTIRRNLLEILEETRPAESDIPFAFRHAFRFTRATPPAPTSDRH